MGYETESKPDRIGLAVGQSDKRKRTKSKATLLGTWVAVASNTRPHTHTHPREREREREEEERIPGPRTTTNHDETSNWTNHVFRIAVALRSRVDVSVGLLAAAVRSD